MSDDTVRLVIKPVGKMSRLDDTYHMVKIMNLLTFKLLNLYIWVPIVYEYNSSPLSRYAQYDYDKKKSLRSIWRRKCCSINTIYILSLFQIEDLIFLFVFDRISTISLFGRDILRQFVTMRIVFCWAWTWYSNFSVKIPRWKLCTKSNKITMTISK